MLGSRVHQSEGLATIPNELWEQTWIGTGLSANKVAVLTTSDISCSRLLKTTATVNIELRVA